MSDEVIARLRHKIVLASLASVLVSLTALVFAINYTHYRQVDASLRDAMEEIASSLEAESENHQEGGLQLRGGLDGDGDADAGEDSRGVSDTGADGGGRMMHGGRKSARTQYASRFFCVLVDTDGTMLVRAKGSSELSDDDACALAQHVLASGGTEGYLDDYKYVMEASDELEGQGLRARMLFLDCTTDLRSLRQLLAVSLAVGGCALVVAALFVVRFSHLAVRPLEESARKQKQFVADAGHELKTPLSVIATNMDILDMDLEDHPEEKEWIDSTNRQVDAMRRLVDDLIVLSKMEEQETDLVLTEVSLTDLAYECVSTFEPLAQAQGRHLVSTIAEDVLVRADEPSVRQLMQILVDNAIKYATGDGTVWIEVTREARHASFATRNHWAHDVDPRDLPTLFDRFVRAEQSRDRSGLARGYGLGLSIARAIAQRNDIKLDVSEDAEGRIVFRAQF